MVSKEKLEQFEEMLNKRRWAKDCLRANIAQPDQIVMRGVKKNVKIAVLQSEVLPKKEVELRELIKGIAPEWFGDEETKVLLNKNVTCKRHRDGNDGHSYILWLGNYVGGALLFDDGTKLTEKYVWHKINGQNYHWNEPHEGLKYGIVLYRQKAKHSKTQQMMIARRKKQTEQKEEQPERPEHEAIEPNTL
jgi:hypothetical protein